MNHARNSAREAAGKADKGGRRYVLARLPMSFRFDNGFAGQGCTLHVSRRGLRMDAIVRPQVGMQVELAIALPTRGRLHAIGRVCSVAPEPARSVDIRFVQISDNDRAELDLFLRLARATRRRERSGYAKRYSGSVRVRHPLPAPEKPVEATSVAVPTITRPSALDRLVPSLGPLKTAVFVGLPLIIGYMAVMGVAEIIDNLTQGF